MARVQILDEAVCISHIANTLGEKYESNYSLSSYGSIVGQTGLFNLGIAISLRGGKLLKKTRLVSHPFRMEELRIYNYS